MTNLIGGANLPLDDMLLEIAIQKINPGLWLLSLGKDCPTQEVSLLCYIFCTDPLFEIIFCHGSNLV